MDTCPWVWHSVASGVLRILAAEDGIEMYMWHRGGSLGRDIRTRAPGGYSTVSRRYNENISTPVLFWVFLYRSL